MGLPPFLPSYGARNNKEVPCETPGGDGVVEAGGDRRAACHCHHGVWPSLSTMGLAPLDSYFVGDCAFLVMFFFSF